MNKTIGIISIIGFSKRTSNGKKQIKANKRLNNIYKIVFTIRFHIGEYNGPQLNINIPHKRNNEGKYIFLNIISNKPVFNAFIKSFMKRVIARIINSQAKIVFTTPRL